MQFPREWTFENTSVASGFDKHVREQLPWYDMVTGAVAHIARHYIPKGGLVYDIGASTGNIGQAIEETIVERKAKLVGIEASAEMCARYKALASWCRSTRLIIASSLMIWRFAIWC